jgi:hypothetical protein
LLGHGRLLEFPSFVSENPGRGEPEEINRGDRGDARSDRARGTPSA